MTELIAESEQALGSDFYGDAIFIVHNGRVDPMHSRKMTAVLQHNNRSDNHVLLRTSGNTGHGSGTPLSETISQQVDRLVFLFDSLGMEYKPVKD